jgi:hypothetical protein
MDRKEAREIMRDENAAPGFVTYNSGGTVQLDGHFTARELEAVLTLMQPPDQPAAAHLKKMYFYDDRLRSKPSPSGWHTEVWVTADQQAASCTSAEAKLVEHADKSSDTPARGLHFDQD